MSKRKRNDGDAAGPVYQYSPGGTKGLSCSSSDDFCFLCEFSSMGCGDTDYVSEIITLVKTMVSEGKEVPTIARAVARAYEEGVRQFVVWENPDTGETVQNPEWTRESITRHILYSQQFQVFSSTVGFIFERLIAAEQQVCMEPISGQVHQEAKNNLLKTINAYADWQVKMAKLKSAKSGT